MYIFLVLIFWIYSDINLADKGWKMHTIDASSSGADGVKLADINGDGLLDIVTGWEEGGITKMYPNPGPAKAALLWPSVIVGQTPKVEDAVFADMDDDGMLDIVSCTEKNSEKIYVHFSQSASWLDASAWHQEILPASEGLMQWMYAEPHQVDGQNGVDLIAAAKGENAQIGWFEAPEAPGDVGGWKWHPISPMGWIMSIILRDMDGDNDIDVVVTDRRSDMQACRWLENPGIGSTQKELWESHTIGAEKLEVMFMAMADLDLDGVEEAIVAERSNQSIRIFKKMNSAATKWDETIIDIPEITGMAKSVEVGDVNKDGVPDLVVSTNTNGLQKVGLYWMDGKELDSHTPTFRPISGKHKAKYDKAELADLNGDGSLDVLICEENYGENSEGLGVVWYENPL